MSRFVRPAALVALLAAALTVWPMLAPVVAQGCDAPPILIHNVGLWTPDGVVGGRDVVFRAGRVAAIEPARTEPRPAVAITGRQLLRSGVTSGRLHLATIEAAARLEAQAADACAPLPRLQVGGPGLSGAAERDVPAFQGAKTAADAIAKVGRAAEAGLDWIAVHDADRFADTVHAARVLRSTEVGRLAVGSRADFVLYRGDAEAGAFGQARVLAVGKGGVLYVADGAWVGPPISAAR